MQLRLVGDLKKENCKTLLQRRDVEVNDVGLVYNNQRRDVTTLRCYGVSGLRL